MILGHLLLKLNHNANHLYNSDLQKNINIEPQSRKFLLYYRLGHQATNAMVKLYCRLKLRNLRLRYGLEISSCTKIGRGLYLGHAFNITINPTSVLGENVSVHKGVLIGASNRGISKGAPIIGNCVWIGCNAAIVGNITIGDDVLIAPNSFVNHDIPSHSIVYGNPCVIKHRDNATENYITIV